MFQHKREVKNKKTNCGDQEDIPSGRSTEIFNRIANRLSAWSRNSQKASKDFNVLTKDEERIELYKAQE